VLQREAAQHVAIATADKRAGRIGRINTKDSAGLAVDAQRGGIDDPFAGELDELIRTQRHPFERGDDFEQRIRRRRHEHFIAGITEQLEDPGIALARAGGQEELVDRHTGAARRIVIRDRRASRSQAERIRILTLDAVAAEERA